jgi:hypothetical protein
VSCGHEHAAREGGTFDAGIDVGSLLVHSEYLVDICGQRLGRQVRTLHALRLHLLPLAASHREASEPVRRGTLDAGIDVGAGCCDRGWREEVVSCGHERAQHEAAHGHIT